MKTKQKLNKKNQFLSLHFWNQKARSLAICAMLLLPSIWGGSGMDLSANNLQIGATSLPSTTSIQFTIKWDNSWKVSSGTNNYDAVWVFVKYQDCTTNLWTHVSVTGNSVTGGVLQIDNTADTKGVFIHRTADGNGSIASATVTLNMTTLTDAGYNYQVFAVEMVYIPTASFWLGNNNTSSGFQQNYIANYNVTSNAAIATLRFGSTGNFYNLPAAYPEGYDAFYCMKYEITQEQYARFLNTLTYDQQVNRAAASPSANAGTLAMTTSTQNRNGIKVDTSGVFNSTPAVYGCDLTTGGGYNQADDGQNIACNWLKWDDLLAYLDWSALRPMSELEWEKACRGTAAISADEYVWGSSIINEANSGAINLSGQAGETSTSTADGLCAYAINNTANGPLRVGFAATGSTGRTGAGATFYGVMDMGGNVWEQMVDYEATTFTTVAGDGALITTPGGTAGNANTANWPAAATNPGGGVLKGGNWFTNNTQFERISNRNLSDASVNRDYTSGGRGVRMP